MATGVHNREARPLSQITIQVEDVDDRPAQRQMVRLVHLSVGKRRRRRNKMHGWMTIFGLLAIGGATGADFEAGKLACALFGTLFVAAWLSKTAGRRA